MWLLLVAACGTVVTLDGLAPFGPVGSALLIERTIGDGEPTEYISLTRQVGYCETYAEAIQAQIDANRAYADALDEADTNEEECAAGRELLDLQAEIWAPLQGKGDRELWLRLGGDEPFMAGPPAFTDTDGTTFSGALNVYTANPFEGASERLDCDDPRYLGDAWDLDAWDEWWLTAGELTVSGLSMSLQGGQLAEADADGEVVASVDVETKLESCPVEVE